MTNAHFFSDGLYEKHQNNCSNFSQQLFHSQQSSKRRNDHVFRKNQKLFFSKYSVCSKTTQNNCRNPKTPTTEPTFPKKSKAVFSLSIRYRETSQTQDVKSQSTERSVRKIAQPKRDSAFEQKTRIISCRETSKNIFVTTKEFLERTRRFGKFLFCSRNKSCFHKYSITNAM